MELSPGVRQTCRTCRTCLMRPSPASPCSPDSLSNPRKVGWLLALSVRCAGSSAGHTPGRRVYRTCQTSQTKPMSCLSSSCSPRPENPCRPPWKHHIDAVNKRLWFAPGSLRMAGYGASFRGLLCGSPLCPPERPPFRLP